MFQYPYGDEQQLNLNWIINEIIQLHKQLDPEYSEPSFSQIYPFSNTAQLNLDWILDELKKLKELAPVVPPTEEIDEIGQALLAGAYDAETEYQKNDYIIQDGKAYRATEATTGIFDSTKWREVKIADDLAIITRWSNATNTYLNNLNAGQIAFSESATYDNGTVGKELQAINSSLNPITLSSYADITAFLNDNDSGFARFCYVPATFINTLTQGKISDAIGIGYISKTSAAIADLFLRTGYDKIWTIRVVNGITTYATLFLNSNLITGNYELSYTASKAYAINDIVNVQNASLLRITEAISSGATFVVGTNCERVTVGELLAEVKGSLNYVEASIAIVADGNTHMAIASGQYVYIKNHNTLADGLYKATTNIPLNNTITQSDVTAVSNGGLNDVKNETGANYCKMPDGTLICWGSKQATYDANNAFWGGSWYYGDLGSVVFPERFYGLPSTSFTKIAGADLFFLGVEQNDTQISHIYIARPTSETQITSTISWTAVGRWKA